MKQWKVNKSKNTIRILFAVLFPIIPYYFQILGFNASNVLAAIFIILTFTCGGLHFSGKIKCNLLIFAFILWILCTCLCNVLSEASAEAVFFLLRIFAIFICIGTIKDKRIFNDVLLAIVYTYGVIAFFGVIEAITRFNIFSLINNAGATFNYNAPRFGLQRILTFGAHTIVHGLYVMFGLALCLYLLQFYKKESKPRKVIVCIYLLLWINLILTLSRSAILCTILCHILLLIFMGAKKMLRTILKCIAILVVTYFTCVLVAPEVAEFIRNSYFMVLAVFNDNYLSIISSTFGNDNLNAFGNRTDLYDWVTNSMNRHWIFGNGVNARFDYAYQDTNGEYFWMAHKTSIEVQYLATLYRYGIAGLLSECMVYITLLCEGIKKRKYRYPEEKKLSFNQMSIALFISYYVAMFMVNSSSERNMFFVIVVLFISYNFNQQFAKEEGLL